MGPHLGKMSYKKIMHFLNRLQCKSFIWPIYVMLFLVLRFVITNGLGFISSDACDLIKFSFISLELGRDYKIHYWKNENSTVILAFHAIT